MVLGKSSASNVRSGIAEQNRIQCPYQYLGTECHLKPVPVLGNRIAFNALPVLGNRMAPNVRIGLGKQNRIKCPYRYRGIESLMPVPVLGTELRLMPVPVLGIEWHLMPVPILGIEWHLMPVPVLGNRIANGRTSIGEKNCI